MQNNDGFRTGQNPFGSFSVSNMPQGYSAPEKNTIEEVEKPAPAPAQVSMPKYAFKQEGPPPVSNIDYIPGYLASNIGKNIKAEFVVGTSQYVEKTGKLIDVGVNYFVLEDANSKTNIMCDLYSVKFVTVIV